MRRLMFLLIVLAGAVGVGAAGVNASDETPSPGPTTLGSGTELVYDSCYEQVAGFRVPVSLLESLGGSELPPGFAYRTFDAAGSIGQLNVIGLECTQGGHEVTDLLVNALVNVPPDFSTGRPTALRVRTYTTSPESRARHALFCFGSIATLADVEATVDLDPSTGARLGRVLGTDGTGSIDLRTATSPAPRPIAPATLQHFTVVGGAVRGRIEWGSADPGISQPVAEATVVLDGVMYTGFGGQHVFPPDGGSATFFHRGLTSCAPGLDWND